MRILVVGLTNIDVLNFCDHYPNEDEDIHVSSQSWIKGGNAANTACVLSQFNNVEVHLLSCLSTKVECSFIQQQLCEFGVNIELCPLIPANMPTSTCIINKENGSRTILHCRNNFPELSEEQFQKVDLSLYDWVHFEGRNLEVVEKMIASIKKFRGTNMKPVISGEMEKVKRLTKLESCLLKNVDILFVGKDVARAMSFSSSLETVTKLSEIKEIKSSHIFCTWGDKGASIATQKHESYVYSTHKSNVTRQIVDTLGAGDTFIAGAIHGCLLEKTAEEILCFACDLALRKCCQYGFHNLIKS